MCGFARPCDQQLRLPIGKLDLPLLWTIGSGSHTAETEASWARPRRPPRDLARRLRPRGAPSFDSMGSRRAEPLFQVFFHGISACRSHHHAATGLDSLTREPACLVAHDEHE